METFTLGSGYEIVLDKVEKVSPVYDSPAYYDEVGERDVAALWHYFIKFSGTEEEHKCYSSTSLDSERKALITALNQGER